MHAQHFITLITFLVSDIAGETLVKVRVTEGAPFVDFFMQILMRKWLMWVMIKQSLFDQNKCAVNPAKN